MRRTLSQKFQNAGNKSAENLHISWPKLWKNSVSKTELLAAYGKELSRKKSWLCGLCDQIALTPRTLTCNMLPSA